MSRPYPSRSVRLFVKNFPRGTSEDALRRYFESATCPSDVLELTLRGVCATVRMRDEAAGERARRELHGRQFRGLRLSVHRFRGIKIFVGGLTEGCTPEDLRTLFQEFGPVAECDIVKDYAFVHMENDEDGRAAIENLSGTELKGRRITVQRSVKDAKYNNRRQNSEQDPGVGGDTFLDPYYKDQTPEMFDQDYRLQSSTGQAAAYRNGAELEDNSYPEASRGRARSAQSHSYGSKSYDSHSSVYENQAAYDMWDDVPASYSTQYSDSLSTRDRASGDVAYQSAPDRLASGYRAQSARSELPHSQRAASSVGGSRPETTSRHLLYERVRLSPPSVRYEDLYSDELTVNKRHMTKQMDDSYCPPYEYVRLSPPHSSRNDFNRRGNGPSRKYAAKSESASRHTRLESASRHGARLESASRRRPYERICLSPPRRSPENHRSYR